MTFVCPVCGALQVALVNSVVRHRCPVTLCVETMKPVDNED